MNCLGVVLDPTLDLIPPLDKASRLFVSCRATLAPTTVFVASTNFINGFDVPCIIAAFCGL